MTRDADAMLDELLGLVDGLVCQLRMVRNGDEIAAGLSGPEAAARLLGRGEKALAVAREARRAVRTAAAMTAAVQRELRRAAPPARVRVEPAAGRFPPEAGDVLDHLTDLAGLVADATTNVSGNNGSAG